MIKEVLEDEFRQSSKEGRRRCEKCYKKACKEAFKWDEPYFFRCHAGLVMWASPLQIDQKTKPPPA